MLLQRLRELQAQRRLSDREVAQRIGIPRSTWQRTRAGSLPMSERAARAARTLFPEAEREITMFLLYGEDGGNASETRCTGQQAAFTPKNGTAVPARPEIEA